MNANYHPFSLQGTNLQIFFSSGGSIFEVPDDHRVRENEKVDIEDR